METVKGKKSNSFREAIVINGQLIKSPLFKRKTDCKQWLAQQKSEKSKMQLYGDLKKLHEKITINQYAEQWLTTKSAQGMARSTLTNYDRFVRVHIVPFFNHKDLKVINKNDVESFQVLLKQRHNPKGVNLIICALKSLFREAIKEGYLIKNPCEYIKSLYNDNQNEIFWSKAEVNQFLSANIGHELYYLFLVALNTGMRKGELAGLCWDRIDFMKNQILVTRTRDKYELKDRTKTKLSRRIPMNAITKTMLYDLFKKRTENEKYVFLNKKGSPINPHHIYRNFQDAQKKAKMFTQIRFHDTRHTFASNYLSSGGKIEDLQKILGHTNITMTMRYVHHSSEHLQGAMDKFSLGHDGLDLEQIKNSMENVLVMQKPNSLSEKLELTQNPPKIFIEAEII